MSAQGDTAGRWQHPATIGRAPQLDALAAALRRLNELAVTSAAPASVLSRAQENVAAAAQLLATHVPDPVPSITQPGPERAQPDEMSESMALDCVIGRDNPLAPPVTLRFDSEKAYGDVSFGAAYEGPPGCVHGGVLASVFDIVLTAANIVRGVAGPTKSLTIRYRRPTRLRVASTFEGWVSETDERQVGTIGRLLQGDVVTVEAEGVFALIDRDRILAMG